MSNYIHAYLNTPITFNPYQYKPLMELRQHPNQNLLISDEVGLGKTIEAGIIIDDLLKANPEARILVICPAFLREKWAMELEEKFYLLPVIFDSSYKPLGERVIILPVSRLSQFNIINGFNLIIVDEIHYFKNRKSRRYSYLQEIINGNPKARRVFMSATPINNTGDDYQSIVKLIGGKHLSTNTTKRQSYIDLKKRNVKDIWIDLSPEEQEIYDTTDELPAFSGTIYRHIGASSLHSLYVYANQGEWTELKNELRSSLDLLAVEEDEELSEFFEDISPTIRSILPETDSKLKELYNVLSQTTDSHIVIFTHYIETVKYLYEKIRSNSLCYPEFQTICYLSFCVL